MRYKANDGVV